jgi:DNA-binding MarR family transcriptional regulator
MRFARAETREEVLAEVAEELRLSGVTNDIADQVVADRLGLNRTDTRCLDIVERLDGVSAGRLASEAGLSSGAVTTVIDRLERAGYARRVPDPADRRRVRIEVTDRFYKRADGIWAKVAADWRADLGRRFTAAELEVIVAFLRASNELTRDHLERL